MSARQLVSSIAEQLGHFLSAIVHSVKVDIFLARTSQLGPELLAKRLFQCISLRCKRLIRIFLNDMQFEMKLNIDLNTFLRLIPSFHRDGMDLGCGNRQALNFPKRKKCIHRN